MEDRIARLEAEVTRLSDAVARLEGQAISGTPAAPLTTPTPSTEENVDTTTAPKLPIATVTGRGVLILGGAFILRAFTERSVFEPRLGLLLGVIYAVVWLLAASRISLGLRSRRGLGYGLASVVIIYPLLWEAANGLNLMPHALAAVVLGCYTLLSLVICIYREQRVLAWANLCGFLLVSMGLFYASAAKLPLMIAMLAVLAATWWAAQKMQWVGLRWPAALVADFHLLMIVDRASRETAATGNGYPEPITALFLALLLAIMSFGIPAASVLLRRHQLGIFAMLQTVAALVIGLGGAAWVAQAGFGSAWMIGWLTILLAATSYTTAFTYVRREDGRSTNFYYFGTLALMLMTFGSQILVSGQSLAYIWLALAVGAAVLSRTTGRATLGGHAAFLLTAVSVWVRTPWLAVLSPTPGIDASIFGPVHLLVVGVAVVGRILLAGVDRENQRRGVRVSKIIMLLIGLTGLVGVTAQTLGRMIGDGGVTVDESAAVVRALMHALAAVAVAYLHRRRPGLDLGWLAIPILIATGLELLLVNLRICGSITLAVCFMGYGAALILVSRMRR